jgi:hypothetical protein
MKVLSLQIYISVKRADNKITANKTSLKSYCYMFVFLVLYP